jgi:hypothetical protein
MSTTPQQFTTSDSPRRPEGRPAARRYMITADEKGPVIRSVPTPARPAAQPAPAPQRTPETVAEDRRHLIHMRRFLRTALDRNGR